MLEPASSHVWRQRFACGSAAAQIQLFAPGQVRTRQQGAVKRRHAIKNSRPVFLQDAANCLRCRTIAQQHRGRANGKWKGQSIAEAVGEEQLGRRKDNVALLNAENWLSVKLGGANHTRLHMHDALRCTGGAG